MRDHAKASPAGSSARGGSRLGRIVRGAFATRGASGDADGSGAPARRLAILAPAISVLLALAFAAPASAEVPTHSALPNLSHDLSSPSVGSPCGVAVDSQGDLYVADSAAKKISVYAPSGSPEAPLILSFSTESFFVNQPCRLAVDDAGDIYVGVSNRKELFKLKPKAGQFPPTGGTEYELDTSVNGNGAFVISGTVGVASSTAVDPSTQNVYVSSTPASEVEEFTKPSESYALRFNGEETTTPALTSSSTCAEAQEAMQNKFGGSANVTVANGFPSATRCKITFKGAYANTDVGAVEVIKAGGNESAFEMFKGSASPHVSSFQPNGSPISNTIGASVSGATYFGVGVYGKNGNVYVADKAHGKVDVFNNAGATLLASFDGSDSQAGAFAWGTSVTEGFPALSVDQSNGHVYVSDLHSHGVVDEFDGAGNFVSQLSDPQHLEERTVGGAVAVDNGSSSPNRGAIYFSAFTEAGAHAKVYAFGPLSYSKLLTVFKGGPGTGTVTSSPAAIDCGITCHAGFAAGEEVILTATPDPGATFSGWTGCDSVSGNECHVTMNEPRIVAATFLTRHLTVVKSGSGSGTVTSTPAGIGCGATCAAYFPDGTVVTLTQSAAPGSKLKAWSGCDEVLGPEGEECKLTMGGDRSVGTEFAAEPAIGETSSEKVSSSAATIEAKLNPNGYLTSWHFEYADDASYQASGFENAKKAPASDNSAGAGSTSSPVSQTLGGLSPETTYHFRLVATNYASPAGGTNGPEATFTTYAAAPPPQACGNDSLRTGPSAKLPDCRAYEQASPVDKNGLDVLGRDNRMAASVNGDSVLYYSMNGQPSSSGPQGLPLYLAHRDAGSWSTSGVLPPVSYGQSGQILGWLPDFSSVFSRANNLTGDSPILLAHEGAEGPFTTISTDGAPTKAVGASADGSIVYFLASESFDTAHPLTPDAVPDKPNLYAWDRDTNTLTLAGVLPDSACGTPPCISSNGSTVRARYPVADHAVSESGDAYFTDPGSGQLYLRREPFGSPATVHVSASQRSVPDIPLPATFATATPDGAHAFFTSQQELTDESNTTPPVDAPGIARADLPDPLASPPCDTQTCNVDKSLLPLVNTPPGGMVADAEHLYWAEPAQDAIGRSDLNGENEDPHFIDLSPGSDPQDVTVDSGKLYWTNAHPIDLNEDNQPDKGTGTIGRADLNGSGAATNVEPNCITGASYPKGIDVAGGYTYWANAVETDPVGSTINSTLGRADVSTTCAAADADANSNNHQDFGHIGGQVLHQENGDVVVNGGYIYTSLILADGGGAIRRFDLNGNYLDTPVEFSEADNMASLALDGSHLYWLERQGGTEAIGRSDLAGSDPSEDHSFVTGLTDPVGLAVGEGADSGHLYWSTGSSGGTRGADLYRFDAGSEALTDLTPDSTDAFGAEVRGVLGASEDGEYVYFVANAVLANNTVENGAGAEEAEPGNCSGNTFEAGDSNRFSGECSLYLAHGGEITFIARLDLEERRESGAASDAANWMAGGNGRASRVSSDGKTLLFRSQRKLTTYDNTGSQCILKSGSGVVMGPGPCAELYRYQVGDGLSCVSCNPTGAPPTWPAQLSQIEPGSGIPEVKSTTQLRNLSADGNRAFFESADKLVSADVNGDSGCPRVQFASQSFGPPACLDVYEWEADGTGSCHSSSQDGGCLYLISSGTGSEPALFLDASRSGDDAFFFTQSQLVPQDSDGLRDVYDARVDGGLASQHEAAAPQCEGDACRGGAIPPASTPGAGSATFQGSEKPQQKHRKPKRHKGHRHRKHHHKHPRHRTANDNRRASR